MLIGPLLQIKVEIGNTVVYVIDYTRPGAKERFIAEEDHYWNYEHYDYPSRGKFPGP